MPAPRETPAPRVWGAPAVDWSQDSTYRAWADRGVSPSVAAYLARRARAEQELIREVTLMGGPAAPTGGAAAAHRRERERTEEQRRQRDAERTEDLATGALDTVGVMTGSINPQDALLLAGARVIARRFEGLCL